MTRTVSPGSNWGTRRASERRAICSASYCWMMFIGRVLSGRSVTRRSRDRQGAGWDAGEMSLPQIGPAQAGVALGCGTAPGGDGGMVAGHQRARPGAALPLGRLGVMRVFEQAPGEAF